MSKFIHCAVLGVLIVSVAFAPCCQAAQSAWWTTSYQDGGGYWPHRVAIQIRSDRELAGAPVAVAVGSRTGQLPIAGDSVQSVRIVDELGRELVYGLLSSSGAPKRSGVLATGDVISIPAVVPAGVTKTVTIYSGNKQAGPLSEYLADASAKLLNTGFETGAEGWRLDMDDAHHVLAVVSDQPHGGRRAAQMMADDPATPTWFGFKQAVSPVKAGDTYVFRGWVRAENVKGSAGWYIHASDSSTLVVNQVLSAGSGTYDWKPFESRFTLPAGSREIEIGTALYGTGKAWFDDASLEKVAEAASGPSVTVGALESLGLAEPSASGAWSVPGAVRVPVRVYHMEASARPSTLITVPLTRSLITARRSLTPSVAVYDAHTGAPCASILQDGKLSFRAALMPRSAQTFYAYIGGKKEPSNAAHLTPADVLSTNNLVRNADFSQGDNGPTNWSYSGQGDEPPGISAPSGSRVPGGKLGKYALRSITPPGATPHWYGWHQTVPADPGATYLIGAWMKTEGADGDVTLYGHIVDAKGAVVKEGGYFGASPNLVDNQGWTWVQSILTLPPDAAGIELHLTSNSHGTIWYDGVTVRRYANTTPAVAQALESPATKGVAVWEMPVTVKVFRDDPVQPRPAALNVSLARNENRSLQLVLRDTVGAPNVRVVVSPLTNASGQSLPAVKLFRIGYVPIDVPTSYYTMDLPEWQRKIPVSSPMSDGWPGEWPDPMPPLMGALDLAAGQDQPVWLTIETPEGAAPGRYRGRVEIASAGSAAPITIPLTVDVHRFAIPQRPSLAIIYETYRRPARLDEPIFKLLAQYRTSPGDLPEPRFTLLPNGDVSADFTDFNKEGALCFDDLKMSAMWSPSAFYALGWEFRPKDFLGLKAFTPEWEKAYGSALRQFSADLKQRGWDKYMTFYLSDEPHANKAPHVSEDLQKFSKFVQAQNTGLPIYSSTWEYFPNLVGAVTRWGAGAKGTFPLDEMAKRKAAGDTFWFTTDGTQCIDTPYNGSERVLGWWCYKYGVLGHEFWASTWYTYDPWEYGWHRAISQRDSMDSPPHFIRYPNGDGYVLYPGKDAGQTDPVASIRLAAVRDGEYDYEYLTMLGQRIAAAKAAGKTTASAEATMRKALSLVEIPNPGGLRTSESMPDPKAYLTVRDEIADQIDALGR